MPTIRVNRVELYYELQGEGSETIVFGHGLLLSGRMFQDQIEVLKDRYRCIAFDWRTHGRSQLTTDGLDMETLCDDVEALIEALGCGPCHYLGLSMGGFVGLRLALRRPDLLKSLMLLDTSADPEPHQWRFLLMNLVGRWLSPRLIGKQLLRSMFSREFLTDPERTADRAFWGMQLLDNDRATMSRAVSEVLRRPSIADRVHEIKQPTLIVVGECDGVTPPHHSQRLHQRIAGSQFVVIPGAGHITPVESPAAVTAAIESFLAEPK